MMMADIRYLYRMGFNRNCILSFCYQKEISCRGRTRGLNDIRFIVDGWINKFDHQEFKRYTYPPPELEKIMAEHVYVGRECDSVYDWH
jgi:hypothetical protein